MCVWGGGGGLEARITSGLSVRSFVRSFVRSLHFLIPHEKIGGPYFFLSELSPILEFFFFLFN